jgi:hypothetical protein
MILKYIFFSLISQTYYRHAIVKNYTIMTPVLEVQQHY